MDGFFFFLLMGALLAVLASLIIGLFFMARGGNEDAVRSNRLMRWRVGLQFFALACFALALLAGRD